MSYSYSHGDHTVGLAHDRVNEEIAPAQECDLSRDLNEECKQPK